MNSDSPDRVELAQPANEPSPSERAERPTPALQVGIDRSITTIRRLLR
jgi:hypothetical protein